MPLPTTLLRFANAHRDDLTLSVYVEGVPADPNARGVWRVRLRQQLQEVRERVARASEEEHRAFEQCEADLLRRLSEAETAPAPTGWAYFRAAGGDALALTITSGAVETSVRWGCGPSVIPFLRVAAPEEALVVRLDLEHAEVSRWREGALHPLDRFDADRAHEVSTKMGSIPRQGFHSGTRGRSQADEAQRQRTDGQTRLREQALRALSAHDDGHSGIILGGASRTSARFLAALPPAVAERTIVAPAFTMRTTAAKSAAAIRAALRTLRLMQNERRVATLLEDARTKGLAVCGLESARAAVDAGAVGALLFSERAWRKDPDAIEALVHRALAAGADVECAANAEPSWLDSAPEGIIAALRFPIPSAHHATTLEEI